MKRILVAWLAAASLLPALAVAAEQDRFTLPQPYLDWERQYLKDFPDLQPVMDTMVRASSRQLKDPTQDILHNRVCSALAQRMAVDMRLPRADRRLIVAADLLHNISKEERPHVLTDVKLLQQASGMVERLRADQRLAGSPAFWSDPGIFARTSVGTNLSLVHHVTGALAAGEILRATKGYGARDIERVQEAIVTHSTGYWYFRKSIDDAALQPEAWRKVYPEPEGNLAKIVHDADLISQFEAESVVPEGSKWRVLAAKRWGAKGSVEEGHVVYYVFQRLFDEARTPQGKALAAQEWNKIRPELVRLMGLAAGTDPIQARGVPRAFQ